MFDEEGNELSHDLPDDLLARYGFTIDVSESRYFTIETENDIDKPYFLANSRNSMTFELRYRETNYIRDGTLEFPDVVFDSADYHTDCIDICYED